jgi:hypothetical protein
MFAIDAAACPRRGGNLCENPAAGWIAINTIVTTKFDCTGFVDWTDQAIQPFRGVVVQIETFGAEE